MAPGNGQDDELDHVPAIRAEQPRELKNAPTSIADCRCRLTYEKMIQMLMLRENATLEGARMRVARDTLKYSYVANCFDHDA